MTYRTQTILDVTYATIDGREMLADLFLPETSRRVPAIIFISGDTQAAGDRTRTPDLPSFFADAGFAMIGIDHRSISDASFPAAVEDVRTAIRWLRQAASEFNIDPDRIGLWGFSGGGQLAVLSQTLPRLPYKDDGYADVSDRVQAVVASYGSTEMSEDDTGRARNAGTVTALDSTQRARIGSVADDGERFAGSPVNQTPQKANTENPVCHIGQARLPPILILDGLADTAVPDHQSRQLFNTLARNRQQAMLMLIEGLRPGFLDCEDIAATGQHTVHVRRTAGCEPSIERRCIHTTIHQFFARCFAAVTVSAAAIRA